MTTLEIIWLIGIYGLWALYLTLGGAELGATMLLSWNSRADQTKSTLRAIGPTWQANDVWLIIVIAAMFGAFPGWYAGWAESLYIALVIVIGGLIIRHAGIEFAGHMGSRGRVIWTRAVVVASFLVALIWGMVWAAAADGSIADGGFSWRTLLAGFALVALCLATGAALIARHATGDAAVACARRLRYLGPGAALLAVAAVIAVASGAAPGVDLNPAVIAALAVALAALGVVGIGGAGRAASAVQVAGAVAIAALLGAIVAAVYPYGYAGAGAVDLGRAAAGSYTLALMAGLTVILVPILLTALSIASRRLGAKPPPSSPDQPRGIFRGLR